LVLLVSVYCFWGVVGELPKAYDIRRELRSQEEMEMTSKIIVEGAKTVDQMIL